MKDIITEAALAETKRIAVEKWHEYKDAARVFNNPAGGKDVLM